MDNFFKNTPDKGNESLIEKFCMELKSLSQEDVQVTRRLTIESPYRNDTSESQDFDNKIKDLENLIKRLEDEIDNISNSSNYTINRNSLKDLSQPQGRSEDNDDNNTKEDPQSAKNHNYPVILYDMAMNLENQSTDNKSDDHFHTVYSSSKELL